ncbi:MAG: hypothetical protein HY073_03890, partial [Deltaproteobacteria bacterium]|nr:hypothetical protein [Deltaproteobacteria bacterium]
YGTAIKSILPKLRSSCAELGVWSEWCILVPEELSYRVRTPHLGGAGHGPVTIVEFQWKGTIYSCAIKESLKDLHFFERNRALQPAVTGFHAEVYGALDQWVFMEQLRGYEKKEIVDRLSTQDDFAKKYARAYWRIHSNLTSLGLETWDVAPLGGHNCIFDPESESLRLVELMNSSPISRDAEKPGVLFDALREGLSFGSKGGSRLVFAFELFRYASQEIDLSELFSRDCIALPSHAAFQSLMEYYQNLLLENEMQPLYDLLRNPVIGDLVSFVPPASTSPAKTQVFSRVLIESVKSDNFETFKSLVEAKKGIVTIDDPEDPRYGPEVIQ